jgi:hypothetical protein
MSIHEDIYKIINKSNTSVRRDKKNVTIVRDSTSFRGMPVQQVTEIAEMVDSASKLEFIKRGIKPQSLQQAKQQAKTAVLDSAVTFVKSKQQPELAKRIYDSIYNPSTSVSSPSDPTMGGEATPNLWISPFEANTMYSQKGLPELIINKKSKSILLNGLKIKNAHLSAKQIDQISLNMLRLNIPKIISDAVRDSLVYGGSLVFPMFRRDTPVSTNLNLVGLLKQGILGKGTLDYIITLDRWNTMHLPATNPTQKDYLLPEKYYIPYLGSDVHGSRCSRIITSTQAGFFGNVMTFGWGLSDFCGYAREILNYKIAVQTLPMMIQQMSILARTINVDGILAQEGANILDSLIEENTIRTSEWSMNNPVTMDMLGELKVINRDFAEVPSLLRILRQDLAASANLPEPMLFSSEKGNFSSGDDTEGNLAKQYESVKFVHKDVESQFKTLAKILVIDALGTDNEILKTLPYTEIHFDVPMIANSVERAEIGLNISKTFFELVSGQMPLDEAAKIASSYGGDELSIDSELLARLEKRQSESDEKQKEKFKKEMELLDGQIKQQKEGNATGAGPGTPKPKVPKGDGDDSGYSRLEQEQHEKTKMPGEKVSQKLTKRQ